MLEREPSRTAFAAAAHRAAHQVLEDGRVCSDPLAVRVLGVDSEAFLQHAEVHEGQRGMRFLVVARAKIAETALAAGVDHRGVGQLAVLGAGLDTFAYRSPFRARVQVFEVDHPATQAWKKRRLEEAGIEIPDTVTYVPVNFEHTDLCRATRRGRDEARDPHLLHLARRRALPHPQGGYADAGTHRRPSGWG